MSINIKSLIIITLIYSLVVLLLENYFQLHYGIVFFIGIFFVLPIGANIIDKILFNLNKPLSNLFNKIDITINNYEKDSDEYKTLMIVKLNINLLDSKSNILVIDHNLDCKNFENIKNYMNSTIEEDKQKTKARVHIFLGIIIGVIITKLFS
jgi:hypothetical protein